MNEYQTTLFNNLMTLTDTSESFYYADRKIKEKWFRIFNYRLCSYSDFLAPAALECRGHTFEVSQEGKNASPIRLASHLFPKFFNYRENPFTMNLELSQVVEIAHKMDGSLISTYLYDDTTLFLKTKGSLDSTQAEDAMSLLNSPSYEKFKEELTNLEKLGFTVMMEYCSPSNRIVLPYDESRLTVLGIRSRNDGHFIYFDDLSKEQYPNILNNWTLIECIDNPSEFLSTVPNMRGIEGFVCRMKDGQLFKLKCEAYLALHHTKDSINSPRRLFEAVLEEATDDMKSLFHDDPLAIKQINEMEKFVEEKYNHLVDTVERFYERNKHLERKEYAILGQQELANTGYFGLAMNKYLRKDTDYKAFLKSKWKDLGLKDAEKTDE